MDSFLHGLYLDLERRCVVLEERLADPKLHPDVREHARDARANLAKVRRDIRANVDDPSFQDASLATTYAQIYRRLQEEVSLTQRLVVPAIERYSAADAKLTALVRRLGREVKWPYRTTPLVVSSSDGAYFTTLGLDIISVNAGDDDLLLAWPDIAHEMAHILYSRERPQLLGKFVASLERYSDAAKAQFPGLSREVGGELLAAYSRGWMEELVCDMVATYLLGPSFGGQQVRQAAGRSVSVYQHRSNHPSYDSQLRAITSVLDEMGHASDASEVTRLWSDMVAARQDVKSSLYDKTAPAPLLAELARNVIAGCKALGLTPFDSPAHGPRSVPGVLSAVWKRFVAQPGGYSAWEAANVPEFWRQLGLGGQDGQQVA